MAEQIDSQPAVPQPIKPAGKPKTFNCPNCGGAITVTAVGHSVSAVCQYCSSVIDIANENLHLLKTANERTRPSLLTIGCRGALTGIQWEVIGYVQKIDGTGVYHWDEYLLYNPYHGFRFLSQNKGHWSLFKVLKRAIADPGISNEIRVDGKKYALFLKGEAKVAYVKGEFYWRVKTGEAERVKDYISPPYLLSISSNEQEMNITRGEYIPAKTIAKAFSVTRDMPYQSGVAANQPAKYPNGYIGKIWLTAVVATILATVLQMASTVMSDGNSYVYRNSWDILASEKDKTLVTEPFKLPKRANMAITSYAPLNNDWLELDITVVNDKEEPIHELKQAIEFYSGSDYDGYWSEGSQNASNLIPALDKGEYKLLIDADAGAFQSGQPVHFTIEIKRNIPVWSNFWLTLLLIVIYPCYITFRHKSFEYLRWLESDNASKYTSNFFSE